MDTVPRDDMMIRHTLHERKLELGNIEYCMSGNGQQYV